MDLSLLLVLDFLVGQVDQNLHYLPFLLVVPLDLEDQVYQVHQQDQEILFLLFHHHSHLYQEVQVFQGILLALLVLVVQEFLLLPGKMNENNLVLYFSLENCF